MHIKDWPPKSVARKLLERGPTHSRRCLLAIFIDWRRQRRSTSPAAAQPFRLPRALLTASRKRSARIVWARQFACSGALEMSGASRRDRQRGTALESLTPPPLPPAQLLDVRTNFCPVPRQPASRTAFEELFQGTLNGTACTHRNHHLTIPTRGRVILVHNTPPARSPAPESS